MLGRVFNAGTGWRGESVVTMESILGATLAEQRFRAWALSLFSVVALFLAAMGIYGVVATMVGLAAVGLALGLAGSVVMHRILRSLLVNATGFDVRMPLAAGVVPACAVLVACYLPARRAARIDPAPLLHDI